MYVSACIFKSHLFNSTYLNGNIQILYLLPISGEFSYTFKISICQREPSLGRSWHQRKSVAILRPVPLSIL